MLSRSAETVLARRLASGYLDAKAELVCRGYASEIDWQHNATLQRVNESRFLQEAAWVILSAGLSERVVRSRFDRVAAAFQGFQDPLAIWLHRRVRRASALKAFRSEPKIDAILVLTGYIARVGYEHVYRRLEEDAVEFLQRFPFLGPATAIHLAKNIGLHVAKPDRHMVRLAAGLGFENVSELCRTVSDLIGDPVSVVDLVFWRYATLNSNHVAHFRQLALGDDNDVTNLAC